MNKGDIINKILNLGLISLLVMVIYFISNQYAMDNFDYCVTHTCGCTHNWNWEDAIYTGICMMPLIAFGNIIIGLFVKYDEENGDKN